MKPPMPRGQPSDGSEAPMNVITPIDEALDHLELERRRRCLLLIAVGAGAACLAACVAVSYASRPGATGFLPASTLALPAGAIIGLGHAPILGFAIAHKRLAIALPIVYGLTLAAAIAVSVGNGPVWSLAIITLLVPAVALLAGLLPDLTLVRTDRCQSCGYDLSGGTSGACPECGAPVMAMRTSGPESTPRGES